MPQEKTTVAELLDLAIGAERAAEELYRGLQAKFAHHSAVADFWLSYAEEEAGHAAWMERLRDSLTAEQLSQPADVMIAMDARKVARFSVQKALTQVENLEDAYQLVNQLENSETNVIFEFLVENFAQDEKVQRFLRSQLKDHISRLVTDFPTQFRKALIRRSIKAQG